MVKNIGKSIRYSLINILRPYSQEIVNCKTVANNALSFQNPTIKKNKFNQQQGTNLLFKCVKEPSPVTLFYGFEAMTSISIKTPEGNSFTVLVVRAGGSTGKNS